MVEKRFSYNIFNYDFIIANTSHSISLYNAGKQKAFNEYIRGIIFNDILYLRLFYPFENIENLDYSAIQKASYTLLKENEKAILQLIKKHFNIDIKEIKYNVINDILKGIGLCNI